jgi:hypothetical protein
MVLLEVFDSFGVVSIDDPDLLHMLLLKSRNCFRVLLLQDLHLRLHLSSLSLQPGFLVLQGDIDSRACLLGTAGLWIC